MATFKELENKRNEVLKNMGLSEIKALYYDLNISLLNNIGSAENGYSSNKVEIENINATIRDISKQLKKKYRNIGSIEFNSKMGAVAEKYLDLCKENRKFLFLMQLQKDIFIIGRVATNVSYLKNIFLRYYNRILYKSYDLEKILIENGVPVTDVNIKSSSSLDVIAEDYNAFIKSIVNEIEADVKEVEEIASRDIANIINVYAEVNLSAELQQVQQLAGTIVSEYENLLVNPFEDGVKIHATVNVEFLKEIDVDVTVEDELKKIDVPVYDFQKFQLVR